MDNMNRNLVYHSLLDRIPFQATSAGALYDGIAALPVSILLDNVRSMYNVGAFFRTADAARVEKLHLCGITGYPPKNGISKTALGAEETVPWQHSWEPAPVVGELRGRGYEIAAVETTVHAVDLFDWTPRFPVCVVFGHEVDGIRPELSALCDTHVRIPMLGAKHSLNVATAGGIVIYELLRKYRALSALR
jgi:23S rRNA (guanosine2251-2'-O)-methyltransferase